MSWVGNISQKVNHIVNHDSIKYIEKQVQNVGENVMKFYSKLAQVLVTPIEDLVINEAAIVNQQENDAIISHFKSMLGIGEDFADTFDMQSNVEPVKNLSVHESVDTEGTAFGTSASECFSCTSAFYASSASMPILSDLTPSAISCNETIAEMGSNMFPNEAYTIYSIAPENSSSAIALHNDAIGTIKWKSDYDSYGNFSSGTAPSMESFGSSDNCSSETTDFNKEVTNLSHQVEFEESCVIVDYSVFCDVSSEAKKLPSYKKKILDALPPKKRLAREYRELTILNGDNATKCCQETVQLSDSEWELL